MFFGSHHGGRGGQEEQSYCPQDSTSASSASSVVSPSRFLPLPKKVRDRIATVAAETLARRLHAGGRLPPLVFSGEQHILDAADHFAGVAVGNDVVDAALVLDELVQNGVELGIFRKRVLIFLVGPELGSR